MSNLLSLTNITKSYGEQQILSAVSLELGRGDIHAVVGESGCGKTTLLRIVAGLADGATGRVYLDGNDVTHLPPEKRRIGLVFQDYALFPHLTVAKNVTYGMRGKTKSEKEHTLERLLAIMNLPESAMRYPHELSGGQQQRVALARALALDPALLLLDEPFSNLDPIRRQKLRDVLRDLADGQETTSLIVTHDIGDAFKVADYITILKDGAVVQTDTPANIVVNPASEYVERLVDM